MAGGVGGDGVAAFEDAEGAALFELEAEAVEAIAFCAESALGAGGEFSWSFSRRRRTAAIFIRKSKATMRLCAALKRLRARV